jgi:hypothetical protein
MNERDPVIEPEKLAAFLEGRLDARDRAEVADALARSPEAYEIFAEAAAIRADLTRDDAIRAHEPVRVRVFRVLRPKGPVQRRAAGWFLWPPLAAAALLAALLLVPAINGANGTVPIALLDGATLAGERGNGSLERRLGERWTDPGWAVVRGEAATVPETRQAFRLGVRAADYELASDAADLDAVQKVGAELVAMLESLDGGSALARDFERITLRAAEGGDPALMDTDRAAAVSAADALLGNSPAFALGLWVEQARLAASAGVTGFFATDGDAAHALSELVERIDEQPASDRSVAVLDALRAIQAAIAEGVDATGLARVQAHISAVIRAAAR